tara:strand:- start:2079 stop:2498 length:420 start_codon:yes stop_codon:yes gene_type:complete
MATITATIQINSNITSYPVNINKTMTMHKAGGCTGLEETTGLATRTYTSTTQVDLVTVANESVTASGANKVYIRNTGSDKTQHFKITLADTTDDTEEIGRLYGGDWMLFPWLATDANEDIMVQPSTSEKMTLEYMIFHE